MDMNREEIELARRKLLTLNASLIIVRDGGVVYVGFRPGLEDLLLLAARKDSLLEGSSVADKIVGAAAAVIMAVKKVAGIYAHTISMPGLRILEESGIPVLYGERVEFIRDDRGEPCPMERMVLKMGRIPEAYRMLMRLAPDSRGS